MILAFPCHTQLLCKISFTVNSEISVMPFFQIALKDIFTTLKFAAKS